MNPIASLDALGARKIRHTGRTLFDHLFRTWQILATWKMPEHVCLAGLYHSVYGTRAFHHELVRKTDRSTVLNVIGANGDKLVRAFSSCDRRSLFSLGQLIVEGKGPKLTLENGEWLTSEDISDLAAIECANLYEQGANPGGSAFWPSHCLGRHKKGLRDLAQSSFGQQIFPHWMYTELSIRGAQEIQCAVIRRAQLPFLEV